MPDDLELLREYTQKGSEEAFRTLVNRHSGMVHAAALRMLRNEARAEEATQAVFFILAKKAGRLSGSVVLAGWLYRTTRYAALELLREDKRHQKQQEELAAMKTEAEQSRVWEQMWPVLDEVVSKLGKMDRNAVVLRFFEERSFAEVGQTLGISEAAAKMRVGRSLEKLRAALLKRGIEASGAVLMSALAVHSAGAAPAGLVNGVAAAALGSSVTIAGPAELARKTVTAICWSKIKAGAVAACCIGLAALGLGIAVKAPPKINSFGQIEGLAGRWEGTFEMKGTAMGGVSQGTEVVIEAGEQERLCRISMRIFGIGGTVTGEYRFSHVFDESGESIETVDDPQIGRMTGKGVLTKAIKNERGDNWEIGFRTPHVQRDGYSNCFWERRENEFIISRHDFIDNGQGRTEMESILRLKRKT